MRLSAFGLCLTISMILVNILEIFLLQGLMGLMQHLLQLWPMRVLVSPISKSRWN